MGRSKMIVAASLALGAVTPLGAGCSSEKGSTVTTTAGEGEGGEADAFSFRREDEDKIDTSILQDQSTGPESRVVTLYLKGGQPENCAKWSLTVSSGTEGGIRKAKGKKLKSEAQEGLKLDDGRIKIKVEGRGSRPGLRFLADNNVPFNIKGKVSRCGEGDVTEIDLDAFATKFAKKAIFEEGPKKDRLEMHLRIGPTRTEFQAGAGSDPGVAGAGSGTGTGVAPPAGGGVPAGTGTGTAVPP